jgi:biopolymer transport protein ExbD
MSSSSRRRGGMPRVHGSEVNVTPLIDVVMCLIIFFMLVAKIGVATGAKPMDLPTSYLGKSIDDMGNTLTLNILPVGDMSKIKAPVESERVPPTEMQVTALVDGVDRDLPIKADLGGAAQFPLREVLMRMKGRYKDQFKVIIRADADLPFTLVEPVLIECTNAGAENIFFTTQKAVAQAGGPGGEAGQ